MAEDNDKLDTQENATVRLYIAQLQEYLNKLPEVITKNELTDAVNLTIGDSLKNHLTVIDKMMVARNETITTSIQQVIENSEKYTDDKLGSINEDVGKIQDQLTGVARTTNENHGAVDRYIENQTTLNANLNDLIKTIGEIQTTLNATSKTLTTQARLGEQPTFLDRVHDVEVLAKLDHEPRIRALEEQDLVTREFAQKFERWESSSDLTSKVITKVIYSLSSRKRKVSIASRKLWKRIVKTASEQLAIRLILYLGASILGTGMIAEIVNFIEKTKLGMLLQELLTAILGG